MSYQPGRRRGLGWGFWRGLGYVSPVGIPDFASFQSAVIASFPACPAPFDPTCENPRDAAIQSNLAEWTTNPQSCHNIVCGASGQPALAVSPSGSGVGYNTTAGFVATPTTQVSAPAASSGLVSPVFHPGAAASPVIIRGARPVPTAIQSASAANAPGGPLAPSTSPTPVQTQTAPDTSSTPVVLPSSCSVGQSYVNPGQAYKYPPNAGQIAYSGACETIPTGTAPSGTDFGSFLSSIPAWGWGVAAVGAVILFSRGGKR